MAAIHVERSEHSSADDDTSDDFVSEDDDESSQRLSGDDGGDSSEGVDGDSSEGDDDDDAPDSASLKSGMANVIARILAKDTSSSNKALLAKGKTDREILRDISKRRKDRGEQIDATDKGEDEKLIKSDTELIKLEKRKLWEAMSRRRPSDMDVTKEAKLRRIATQGMVQLFQSVHEHQKMLNQKLASVGPSERKKDKVAAEFTKGKFLDLLKNKGSLSENKVKERKTETKAIPKWKILQDDFMMGARMKDWDKDDDDNDNDDGVDNIEGGNSYSSSRVSGNGDVDMSDDD